MVSIRFQVVNGSLCLVCWGLKTLSEAVVSASSLTHSSCRILYGGNAVIALPKFNQKCTSAVFQIFANTDFGAPGDCYENIYILVLKLGYRKQYVIHVQSCTGVLRKSTWVEFWWHYYHYWDRIDCLHRRRSGDSQNAFFDFSLNSYCLWFPFHPTTILF